MSGLFQGQSIIYKIRAMILDTKSRLFRVGMLSPIPIHYAGQGSKVILEKGRLTIVIYKHGVNAATLREFTSGVLQYGLYECENMPFLLHRWQNINICSVSLLSYYHLAKSDIANWIMCDSDIVQLVLVDAATNFVKAYRIYKSGEPFNSRLQLALMSTKTILGSRQAVEHKVQGLFGQLTTELVFRNAELRTAA